jgi:hypothetical protein
MVHYEVAGSQFAVLRDVIPFMQVATIRFHDQACLTQWIKGFYLHSS